MAGLGWYHKISKYHKTYFSMIENSAFGSRVQQRIPECMTQSMYPSARRRFKYKPQEIEGMKNAFRWILTMAFGTDNMRERESIL